jgi:predicted nucleic acid-binding protein
MALVVDASAFVEHFVARNVLGAHVGRTWHAPILCDVEFAHAIRREIVSRNFSLREGRQAMTDYLALTVQRHAHADLLHRALELHANFTAYDALYVALAEQLAVPLLTADQRLARATRAHTQVSIVLA